MSEVVRKSCLSVSDDQVSPTDSVVTVNEGVLLTERDLPPFEDNWVRCGEFVGPPETRSRTDRLRYRTGIVPNPDSVQYLIGD